MSNSTFRTISANFIEGVSSKRNYISNPFATNNAIGWSTYSNTAQPSPVTGTGGSPSVTVSRSTSSPLSGDASVLLSKSASNLQGNGWSTDFTIDIADRAKVLQVEFDYIVASGTFAAGSSTADSDITVWLYDITNATLIQPTTFRIFSNSSSIASRFVSNFQTSATGSQYRLILHVSTTSASAYGVLIDNVSVSPSQYVYGTPISDWTSFTPTGSWVANTTYTGRWRRVGDSVEVQAYLALSGAPTAANLTVNLPSGLVIDTTKVLSTAVNVDQVFGHGLTNDTGVGNYQVNAHYNNTTSVSLYILNAAGTYAADNIITNTVPFTYGAGDSVQVIFRVPIAGWSSSVQTSDQADSRIISFTGTQSSEAVTANVTNIAFTTVNDKTSSWNGTQYSVPVSGDYIISASITNSAGPHTPAIYIDGTLLTNAFLSTVAAGAVSSGSVLVPNLRAGQLISIRSAVTGTISQSRLTIHRLSQASLISATETVGMSAVKTSGSHTSSGSNQDVTGWASKTFDTHNAFDITTGLFTVPVTGIYNISGALSFVSNVTGGRAILVLVDGVTVHSGADLNGSSNVYSGAFNITQRLRAGQVVKLQTFQNSGGSLAYNTGTGYNHLDIFRVGI